MYCRGCGKPVNGKFCSSCGTEVTDHSTAQSTRYNLNGVDFDAISLMTECGIKGQINFAKQVKNITGASLKESTSFASKMYHDEIVLNEVKERQANITQQKILADKKLSEEGVLHCPQCNSTSINVSKNGYGYGKGILGTFLVGPIGLFAGGIGAKNLKATCMNCGYEFSIKKK